MCGICGIIQHDPAKPVALEQVKAMCDQIIHRGPDEEGYYLHGAVGMGMRRLAIIDLSGGSQPIYNEDGTIGIVFNGEIYNYLQLKKTLEGYGHHFATNSDTEAIVHAYEQWGLDCPQKLDGMFVFAIHDQTKNCLVVARDRLGKKPFYYYQDNQRFLFASEIKALFECGKVPARLDPNALDAYLSLGYVPAPLTMFAGIFKLPASHLLIYRDGAVSLHEYWDLKYEQDQACDIEEAERRLKELLWDAVRVRLMSEVPLGAYLSGGIDSSMVVGIMSQLMNKPVETFSMGFEGEHLNELPYARLSAQALGTNHHEIVLTECSPEMLGRIVWHLDEPVADPAAVPTLLLSELARRYVTVVLTGEGGDEIFAGYDYYRTSLWAKRYQVFPSQSLNQILLPLLAKAANGLAGRPINHPRTIWHWSLPANVRQAAWVAIFTDAEKQALLAPNAKSGATTSQNGYRGLEAFGRFYDRAQANEMLHRMMYVDTRVWLPDDLLMKVDKMSMAHSIEARTPYLDHHLIEFVAGLPTHAKINQNVPKYLLKKVARAVLPAAIVDRPKHTFDVPIGQWLNGCLRELNHEVVIHGAITASPIFQSSYIQGPLKAALEENRPGAARQFWTLLNLGLWAQQYQVAIE